ncbi:MAG TPA: CHAT domain-containing protein [Waterburya sp.]|jgi:filamentous hemagglutinin family protein
MSVARWCVGWLSCLLPFSGILAATPTIAIPVTSASDGTGTIVTPNGNRFDIHGGSLSSDGTNLFHSFQQFGLATDQTANFLSSPSIQNILGRVVGGDSSIINGLIQVTGGNSNLFLMNPAGIVFGKEASLNVPASFTATTATEIALKTDSGGNNWFNAFGNNNYQTLIGTPSQFVFGYTQSAAIINLANLCVREGKNLTLLGGSVTNKGQLAAPSGTITVTAVPGENLVRISQQGHLLSLEILPRTAADGQMIAVRVEDLPAMLTGNSGHLFNQGELSSSGSNQGGTINLTGRVVENRGQITANGNNGGTIRIETNNLLDAGAIRANGDAGNGGEIRVNYSGTVIQTGFARTEAKGTNWGGVIEFNGTANSVLTTSGAIDVTAEVGGTVHLFGQDLRLLAAKVDATGNSGGGEILVGGDYQGQTQRALNAQNTFVNRASLLTADALSTGNGGKVIVWSDQQTDFYGSITAKGGSLAGNGGLMEVSSKNQLTFGGIANASAINGQAGQLLVDPKNITIDGSASSSSFQLLDPNPAAGNLFGGWTAVLSNGNVVVSSSRDDLMATDAGAVYLFNPNTGALLGTINGSNANDRFGIGAITALPNGNYVFANPDADIGGIVNAGTVILANGGTGAEINRISGTNTNDRFGFRVANSIDNQPLERNEVVALTNSNYVFGSRDADIGGIVDAGTVILVNGSTGAEINRISGTIASDRFGSGAITALPNGNYVFGNPLADIDGIVDAGTVILANGSTGAEINRISGAFANDRFGGRLSNLFDGFGSPITALPNGNFVFGNPNADIAGIVDAGTVILANGSTGAQIGRISGVNFGDQFGNGAITALSNDNYVFGNPNANNLAGTVILANGSSGAEIARISGVDVGDSFGSGNIIDLPNGNYVFANPVADINGIVDAGTVILANGSTGAEINRISGANAIDFFGGHQDISSAHFITALPNGNYVFGNPSADINGIVDAGTVILANGTTGVEISRLSGTVANDAFGLPIALANGNYVIINRSTTDGRNADAGTAILADGSTGTEISRLSGTNPGGFFGSELITPLSNGNYLIVNPQLNSDAGRGDIGIANPNSLTYGYFPSQNITINPQLITQITNTGTAVTLQANNDITVNSAITTNNPNGNGGNLSLRAGRSILVNANITTDNGNLTLLANDATANGVVNAYRDAGTATITVAPRVTLNSGTGNTTIKLDTGAGLTNNNSGDITLGNIIAGNLLVENNGLTGGNINASAGTLNTSSATGNGGTITLTSNTGAITTSNLNSSGATHGGNITLNASTQITAGEINSSGLTGRGGNVTLDPSGDIQVSSINAQGGTQGGTVDITTSRFLRATSTFKTANGIDASIATVGGNRGGDITIRHGGSGVTPFVVGESTTNGTTGAITSGNFTIPSGNSFLYTYRSGNIRIISVPAPSPSPTPNPSLTPPPLSIPVELTKPQELLNSRLPPPFNDSDFLRLDNSFTDDFTRQSGLSEAKRITLSEVQNTLQKVESATGIKPAIIYAVFVPSTIPPAPPSQPGQTQKSSSVASSSLLRALTPSPSDRLELIVITAQGNPIRRSTRATRAEVLRIEKKFRTQLTNPTRRSGFLAPAQTMYQWLVAPIEPDLQQLHIKNLAYIMDAGLRSISLAALHDGKQFIIERYSVGLMPSLSLTDTRYVDVRNTSILAMGMEKFVDKSPLPSVPVELSVITGQLWPGKFFLNNSFTLSNLQAARNREPFGIMHLATHAQYLPGEPEQSYLQLWDGQLRLEQLRQIGLHKPPVELLVLSACRTALGDEENELGFAGLAAQAGAKTVLASLWYISDEGTLSLMTQFYEQLKQVPLKAEALRLTQLAMLKGKVRLQEGELVTAHGSFPLPPDFARRGNTDFSHPYYWSAFIMIGNPW